MRRLIQILFMSLLTIISTSAALSGAPVKNNNATYTQPDGSSFAVIVKGDEWTRIRTTSDGCAITRDEDGWWCYGIYDEDCNIRNTGCRVGSPVPGDVIARSREIPYKGLAEKARCKRMRIKDANLAALKAVRQANTATKTSGKVIKQGLAILVEFQDVKFSYAKADFERMLNEEGFNGTGSAVDYYEYQFNGKWEFMFDVSDVITLPNNLRYYGANDADGVDIRVPEMVRDACRIADEYIDFSKYDQDGDGKVDNVYVFYAGHDESENTDRPDLIWAHQYYVYLGGGLTLYCDNTQIDRYACSSELSGEKDQTGIGTFCHEFMHTFGVPDFYDTNYDNDGAWAAGLWRTTSLMDSGNRNNHSATPPNLNCIERMILGLSEPVIIEPGQTYSLEPVNLNGQYCMMPTSTEGEYYLFECRSNEGWDKHIGGEGMLVYHIDENGKAGDMAQWHYENIVNIDPAHQCADLIEADMRSDDLTLTGWPPHNIKGIFYPQPDQTSITSANPSYKLWDGGTPELSIVGIRQEGGKIIFSAIGENEVPEVPEVTDLAFQAYPDAIFIEFSSSESNSESALIRWRRHDDKEFTSLTLPNSDDGRYAHMITGVESGNVLYDIRIQFMIDKTSGKESDIQIMSKRSPSIDWPYLYFPNSNRFCRTDGYIAHIINADKAKNIEWILDDEVLTVEKDHRIYPQHSGPLTCRITWENGSTDTIVKEITVTE